MGTPGIRCQRHGGIRYTGYGGAAGIRYGGTVGMVREGTAQGVPPYPPIMPYPRTIPLYRTPPYPCTVPPYCTHCTPRTVPRTPRALSQICHYSSRICCKSDSAAIGQIWGGVRGYGARGTVGRVRAGIVWFEGYALLRLLILDIFTSGTQRGS